MKDHMCKTQIFESRNYIFSYKLFKGNRSRESIILWEMTSIRCDYNRSVSSVCYLQWEKCLIIVDYSYHVHIVLGIGPPLWELGFRILTQLSGFNLWLAEIQSRSATSPWAQESNPNQKTLVFSRVYSKLLWYYYPHCNCSWSWYRIILLHPLDSHNWFRHMHMSIHFSKACHLWTIAIPQCPKSWDKKSRQQGKQN